MNHRIWDIRVFYTIARHHVGRNISQRWRIVSKLEPPEQDLDSTSTGASSRVSHFGNHHSHGWGASYIFSLHSVMKRFSQFLDERLYVQLHNEYDTSKSEIKIAFSLLRCLHRGFSPTSSWIHCSLDSPRAVCGSLSYFGRISRHIRWWRLHSSVAHISSWSLSEVCSSEASWITMRRNASCSTRHHFQSSFLASLSSSISWPVSRVVHLYHLQHCGCSYAWFCVGPSSEISEWSPSRRSSHSLLSQM